MSLAAVERGEPMDEHAFVAGLMAKMSLAEKIGQLNLLSAGEGPETGSAAVRNLKGRLETGQLGAIFGTKSVRSVRAWQELGVAGSRHGIPLFFAEDVIHGHRTIFPLPIALACAFNADLWRKVARVAATEAAAEGINHVYAPMIDIARDPRWGRIAESPGEDPFVASRYAEAMVQGFQGDDPRATDTVIACLKHFIAYGAAIGGRDYDNVSLAPEDVFGVYAPPFQAGIAAGAGSVMAAFNALNKRPMHAHAELIKGWLRERSGFAGLMVADYTGVAEIACHGVGDERAATALALTAGIDMDMMSELYVRHLPDLAVTGLDCPEAGLALGAEVISASIEAACARVLALKHRLGLFDNPYRYCDEVRASTMALAPQHRRVARQAIAESCVLLKNDGVLPLAPGTSVAIIGAMADDRTNLLGTWAVSGDPGEAVTLYDGLSGLHNGKVTCCKGADLVDDTVLADRLNVHGQTVFLDTRPAEAMIKEAVEAATAADVAIVVVGEAKEHSGESSSSTRLELSAPQRRLVDALGHCGTPVVLLVLAGRPLALEDEVRSAEAVLFAWFAGTETGNGLADVLTGGAEPSGRLAAAFPARTGQVPVFHAAEPTGRPNPGHFAKFKTGYLDLPDDIASATGQFPFGYGLSYTRFQYGPPRVERRALKGMDDTVTVRVRVENVGPRFGCDVVQLYVSDPVARITQPQRRLCGFEKVSLEPGEVREVSFTRRASDFAYPIGGSLDTVEWVVDPGTLVLSVGPHSGCLESVEIVWAL
ncbi:MAG: glycoside hydrolase family 3 N-terminal domain-containing protein [Devosia sp.]